MKNEITGFLKYLLILITLGLGLARAWALFAVALVLLIAVFYVQEYRKMYGEKGAQARLLKQKKKQFRLIEVDTGSPVLDDAAHVQSQKSVWLASRASNLAGQGDFANAETDIDEALTVSPSSLITRAAAIEVYGKSGHGDAAIKIIESTPLESFSENHSATALFVFYDRASAMYAVTDKPEMAVTYARKALKVLKSKDYREEDEQTSDALGQPREDIQAYIKDIKKFIADNSTR